MITEERLQEIKDDIKRGRKYDVPNDYDCNYEQIYDDKEELVTALEAAQAELAGRKESNKRYHKQMCDKEDERRITRKRLDETEAELEEVKSKAWKTVDLKEGNPLVFVGVHAVAWQQEWGQPKVGFTRWNDD